MSRSSHVISLQTPYSHDLLMRIRQTIPQGRDFLLRNSNISALSLFGRTLAIHTSLVIL
jgi:hypothetical protein